MLYPFVFEPRLGVSAQSWWWLAGYGVVRDRVAPDRISEFWRHAIGTRQTKMSAARNSLREHPWLAASFVPSALMLAVTTHLSVNLASVPFLWTLPLAVYLLTFILAFGRRFAVSAAANVWYSASGPAGPDSDLRSGSRARIIPYLGLLCCSPDPAVCWRIALPHRFGRLRGRTNASQRSTTPGLPSAALSVESLRRSSRRPCSAPCWSTPCLPRRWHFSGQPQERRRSAWDWTFPLFLLVLLAAAGDYRVAGIHHRR